MRPHEIEAAAAEAALAGRVLPLAPVDLAASWVSRWDTKKAAECALGRWRGQYPQNAYKKEGLGISGLRVLARYRKARSTRWSYCVAPAHADLEAVQADLGFPLADFDPKPLPTPAEQPEERQEAPTPPPVHPVPASPALRLARASLALDMLKPDMTVPASVHTPPRVRWWLDPEMMRRREEVRWLEDMALAAHNPTGRLSPPPPP
jgi:hypothetical protein